MFHSKIYELLDRAFGMFLRLSGRVDNQQSTIKRSQIEAFRIPICFEKIPPDSTEKKNYRRVKCPFVVFQRLT